MKQRKGMVTSELDDGYIVIPTEGDNINKVLSLNDSGGFVWKLLEKEYSFEQIASILSEEYDIPYEQAENDLNEFLEIIKPYINNDKKKG